MDRKLTNNEKDALIALLRAEIRLYQALEPIKKQIGLYFHSYNIDQQDLEECEKVAQNLEL